MSAPEAPAAAPARRRRWPLVVLALLVLILALGACAPSLASGFVPGIAADQFGARFAGRLHVEEAELGWFGRQRIERAEIFDPSGARVASVDVELPGLLELARGGGKRARGVELTLEADLVADDAGVTNLQRALAPRAPTAQSGTGSPPESGGSPWPADLDLAAAIHVRRASWSDARTRAGGGPVLCEGGEIRVDIAPGKPLALSLALPLSGSANGKLDATANVQPNASGVPSIDAKLAAAKLPTALVDALVGHAADGKPRLGPVLGAELDANFELVLAAAGALDCTAQLKGPALAKPIVLRARVTELGEWLAAQLAPKPGAAFALPPKLSAVVALADVPTALLESFAGQGSLRALIGDELDLDLDATLERASADAPLSARGKLRAGPTAPLSADFDVALRELGPNEPSIAGVLPLRSLDAKISATGVASIASKLAPPTAAPWLSLVGDSMQLDAKLDATRGEPTPVSIALSSGVTRFALRGELHAARLVLPGDGLELVITELPAAVRAELAKFVPPGTRVEPQGGIALRGRDLDLPIGGSSLDPLAVLPLSSGDVELELGELRYVDASLAAAKQELVLGGTRATLSLRAGQPLSARVQAGLSGASAGTVEATVRIADPAALARLATDGLPAVDADAKITGLATAALDAWTGRAGLVQDILGERLDLELSARGASAKGGTLSAKLSSPLASATLSGNLGDGLVFAPDEQRTELAFALTPLSSKRVVGSLVPMFVQVASAEPSARASLVLSKFKLPLDGDLSKLDGTIALDLGSVDFGFLPGIAELFGPALSRKGQRLGPYALSIKGGVVSYERLSIDVGGKPIVFSGSCNLAKSEFALQLGIPLAYAGKSIAAQLDKYKQFVPPDLEIPLTIKGAWTKPKIGIADGFIEKLAEGALKGAVKDGLLEGLLGGKKK
ncbi:MAG: hypothetical protein EPO68_02365 [Planctomycetota bacterium]|nr:MAG: hypothetical protein EPO68_02365 [Planctomycetota bacterium]